MITEFRQVSKGKIKDISHKKQENGFLLGS